MAAELYHATTRPFFGWHNQPHTLRPIASWIHGLGQCKSRSAIRKTNCVFLAMRNGLEKRMESKMSAFEHNIVCFDRFLSSSIQAVCQEPQPYLPTATTTTSKRIPSSRILRVAATASFSPNRHPTAHWPLTRQSTAFLTDLSFGPIPPSGLRLQTKCLVGR